MLAMRYLSDIGQVAGEFVRETDPPWDLWWELPSAPPGLYSKLSGYIAPDEGAVEDIWPIGTPASRCREIDWSSIFQSLVSRPADSTLPSAVTLIKTFDRAVFFEIIRQHFLLQQGKMEFSAFPGVEPFWLLKIENPSIWALEAVNPMQVWWRYNQVPAHPGLFVECSRHIDDPANGLRLSSLRFGGETIILLNPDGNPEILQPRWKSANSVIHVDFPPSTRLQADETAKVTIAPRLRPTDERKPAELWSVSDPARLQSILSNEPAHLFQGYSAWFGKNQEVWVMADNERSDRGLAEVFSDAFPAFARLDRAVFVPVGQTLSPRLPADRLREIFRTKPDDVLCLEPETEKVTVRVFPGPARKKLDTFITFQSEQALRCLETYESMWEFSFPELKKKE